MRLVSQATADSDLAKRLISREHEVLGARDATRDDVRVWREPETGFK